jgi:hypothetical protein
MIALEGDGEAFEIETKHTLPEEYTYQSHIKSMIESIAQSNKTDILIYIHGGMKDIKEAIDEAEEQTRIIAESTEYYPIYINWDSGINSAYFEQLLFIRQGKREPVLGPISAPLCLFSDLGQAILQMPITLGDEIYRHFFKSVNQNSSLESINSTSDKKYWQMYFDLHSMGSEEYDDSHFTDISVYLLGGSPKLITTPMVDAFGKKAWISMQRRTREIFQKNKQKSTIERERNKSTLEMSGGGLGRLMDELAALMVDNPEYKITLIGHSMGTMVINEIIKSYPDLKYQNIVYMAAACSMNDFEDSVIPYLRQPQNMNTNFYNLTLHPSQEMNEKMYGEMILKGSFLEWIDNFLSDPTDVTDRTMGKWENVVAASHIFPEDLRDRIIIKKFGLKNAVITDPEPLKHGEFNDTVMRFWEKRFWYNSEEEI